MNDADVDLNLVNGDSASHGNVEFANELKDFASAVASRDEAALVTARDALLEAAGPDVVVDAAGVAANFQRMVRIADSTGIPVDADRMEMYQPAVDALNLRRFKTAETTPL